MPMNYEMESERESNETEIASGIGSLLTHGSSEGHDSQRDNSSVYLLRVKSGHHKRVPGFQPELVCLNSCIDRTTPPYRITSLSINAYANL